MEILTEYGIEIFFGLVSAGLLAWCKSLFAQKKKLEETLSKYQNSADYIKNNIHLLTKNDIKNYTNNKYNLSDQEINIIYNYIMWKK